jgi:hypothetical protein
MSTKRRAPSTPRVPRPVTPDAAYRRLAIQILGLDVKTLTSELRAARLERPDQVELIARLPTAA